MSPVDQRLKAVFDQGFDVALEVAAGIAAADIEYETWEFTGGCNTKRKHLRVSPGSRMHADAIRKLIRAKEK